MRLYLWSAILLTLMLVPLAEATEIRQQQLSDTIAQAAGMEPTVTAEGVVRLGWARSDVAVNVEGMPLRPPAGLGSWAAFKSVQGGARVMGDTVVFEDEITPAMDAALAQGLEITALHNHFVFDDPPVYFMHIGGTGEPAKLAQGVKATWEAIKALRQAQPRPQRRFPGGVPKLTGKLNVKPLQALLESEPQVQEGVVKFTFGREGKMHGVQVGPSMGLSTWAAFSGDQDLAAVDGDFIMTADEVQPVIRALRDHGLHIVALHNHMVGETPTFYFLHYWGKGPAAELATGIKAALDVQGRS
jgi:hypothetical protein